MSLEYVCLNKSRAISRLNSLSLLLRAIGHPPRHMAKIKSSTVSEDWQKSNESGLSNSSFRETVPFDSSLSNRLIGSIGKVDILRVPVCGVSTVCDVEPVRIYKPGICRSSTDLRTAPQIFGASCHSSISLGLSPIKSFDGCTFATDK